MAKPFERIRFIVCALALAFIVVSVAPVSAQAPVNPTASAVKEQQLLNELGQDSGPRHYS